MKLNIKKYAALMACTCGLTLTSCVGDLDVTPINPQQTQVANDDALFNKLYATFSLTGQQGNAGKPDIPSSVMNDEGFTQYYRMQWYLNEFTSDEAAWNWSGNDGGIQELMYNKYTANNGFALGLTTVSTSTSRCATLTSTILVRTSSDWLKHASFVLTTTSLCSTSLAQVRSVRRFRQRMQRITTASSYSTM